MTTPSIASLIAKELTIPLHQVTATVTLLDDGNTIPFIARYRKEVTGGLDEVQIRDIQARLEYLRKLAERHEAVKAEIASQEKLTDELAAQLDAATTLQAVEDLYRPYKPKRQTRAQIARASAGWSRWHWHCWPRNANSIPASRPKHTSPTVCPTSTPRWPARATSSPSGSATIRRRGRPHGSGLPPTASSRVSGRASRSIPKDATASTTISEPRCARSSRINGWRSNAGSEDGSLKVRIETPDGAIIGGIEAAWIKAPGTKAAEQMRLAIGDGYERLLRPSVEREVSGQLSEFSDDHAITVFAANLRNLLLQPPLRERAIMGIDPGFRTGCKVATVDPTGKLLHTVTIYPHPPQNDAAKARQVLAGLVQLDKISVIAIGNGTAGRETEALAAELIQAVESPASRLRDGQRSGRIGLLRVRHRPGGVP